MTSVKAKAPVSNDADLELEGYGQGALLFAGLESQFEKADDAVAVCRCDGERGLVADGIADVGVEEAVIAGD